MDAPVRVPPDAAGLLERLLDEAERASESQPTAGTGGAEDTSIPTAPSAMPAASGEDIGGMPGGLPGGLSSKLLSNPAIIAALPSLLENIGPLLGGGRPAGDGSDGGGALPVGAPVSGKRPGGSPDRHTALLCAVKPYLSRERQEAAEAVLRLCRVWDALARSGVMPGGLGALLRAGERPPVAPATDDTGR